MDVFAARWANGEQNDAINLMRNIEILDFI